MKRNFKKTLSLVLAVLMIFAVVPFSGMAAECSHPNMKAQPIEEPVDGVLSHFYFCSKCGYSLTEGCSSSDTQATCGNPVLCDTCNRVLETADHVFDQKIEAPATLVGEAKCNEYNKYYKSCTCGAVSDKEADIFTSADKKGTKHNFTKKVMEEQYIAKTDCGDHPYYYYLCADCDTKSTLTYANSEITIPHIFEIPAEPVEGTEKSAPTCTSPAVFYKICEKCGYFGDDNETYTYGNKAKHNFVNFENEKYVLIPNNCSNGTLYSKSCSLCKAPAVENMWDENFDVLSDEYDITIGDEGNAFYANDALNHNKSYVSKAAKAPTCTADGNNEEIKCEYCDAVLSGGEVLPALKHSYDKSLGNAANLEVIKAYKAPTCVQYGELGKGKCTREGCGNEVAINAKGEVMSLDNLSTFDIEPLKHLDEDGDMVCERVLVGSDGKEYVCGSLLKPEDTCTCICHGTGFMYFIGWILKWIWSLTGSNPYCKCGIAHYEVD